MTEYNENNDRNFLLFSSLPSSCLSSPCVLGIDEAGRGPVLGPMVYACAFCPVDRKDDLEALGVDDSKALTEAQRDALLDKVLDNKSYIGWAVHILAPRYEYEATNTSVASIFCCLFITILLLRFISNSMYRRGKYNLNTMSHDTAADLVRGALDRGVQVAEIYVDTVGPPEKYQAKLEAAFPTVKVTVAKKADSLYPCVSAASICAKVARDRVLRDWKFAKSSDGESGVQFTQEWGSGYPGDPVTKRFLQENLDPLFGFPSLVRFSWKTAEKLLEEKCSPVQFEEVEPEEEDSVKKNPSDASQADRKKSAAKRSAARLHPYFSERGLKIGERF